MNSDDHSQGLAQVAPPHARLIALLSAIGTVWIFFLMVLILIDVIGRGAFNTPLIGVPEMVRFSIVGIVFLQLPQTLRTGGLTRSDVLLGKLLERRARLGHALQGAFHLTGLALFIILFVTLWPVMIAAFRAGDFYGAAGVVQIPTGPLFIIIMVGCAAMSLQFLLFAWHDLAVALGLGGGAAPRDSSPEGPMK